MRHEKIIKRPDGSKVAICVNFWDSANGVRYDISLKTAAPNKRKFVTIEQDNYIWRALSMEDRRKSDMELYLQHVSKEEIQEAKQELWMKLKP